MDSTRKAVDSSILNFAVGPIYLAFQSAYHKEEKQAKDDNGDGDFRQGHAAEHAALLGGYSVVSRLRRVHLGSGGGGLNSRRGKVESLGMEKKINTFDV